MQSIFLVTEKQTQSRLILVYENEKAVYADYSPRTHFVELLEKVSDPSRIAGRIEFYIETYDVKAKPKVGKKSSSKSKPRKPRPKGLVYKISDEDRERRKKQFSKENHPNVKRGFSEEHRAKLSAIKKGKPSNHTGKKHTLAYKILMSEKMKGNKNRDGWVPIYNPITGETKEIKDTDKLPHGYRYGRGKQVVERFYGKDS